MVIFILILTYTKLSLMTLEHQWSSIERYYEAPSAKDNLFNDMDLVNTYDVVTTGSYDLFLVNETGFLLCMRSVFGCTTARFPFTRLAVTPQKVPGKESALRMTSTCIIKSIILRSGKKPF